MSQGQYQGKYLNMILTANAALLSALVWMQMVGGGALSSAAHAQRPPDTGIPNAAAQRQRMIEELQGVRTSVDAMRKTVEGGKMKIVVGNIDEIRAASKPAEDGKGK